MKDNSWWKPFDWKVAFFVILSGLVMSMGNSHSDALMRFFKIDWNTLHDTLRLIGGGCLFGGFVCMMYNYYLISIGKMK